MSIEVLSKRCTKCGEIKPVSDFYREKHKRSGYHSHCKVCHRASTKAAQARRRARMGEDAWLAHQRELVARSRERRQMSSERTYSKARWDATQTLIQRHQSEFDHLLLLARRGELSEAG